MPGARFNSGNHVVFTAVDGTLLDGETVDSRSRAVLRRLFAAAVPVVPVTAMTLEEIEPIANELELRHAMIVEAGGAIARWTDERWEVEPCGLAADEFLDVIREIEDCTGASLFVEGTPRLFSGPFVIESGNRAAVESAAASLGFTVRQGEHSLYLGRSCDEGEAFTRLRDELHCDVAIAVGSSLLDAEFLARAEIAIIVPRSDGKPDPELVAQVPHARIAPASGTAGWAAAIAEVCFRQSAVVSD